jgi:hypothetical protein
MTVVGKFEGDPFERLYCRLSDDKAREKLLIRTEAGEEVEFELVGGGTFVCVDPSDDCAMVMDIRGSIIVLKFESAEALKLLMKFMPPAVFEVGDSDYSTVGSIKSGIANVLLANRESSDADHCMWVFLQTSQRKK